MSNLLLMATLCGIPRKVMFHLSFSESVIKLLLILHLLLLLSQHRALCYDDLHAIIFTAVSGTVEAS